MPRSPRPEIGEEAQRLIDDLAPLDTGVQTLDEQLALVQAVRAGSPERAADIDRALLARVAALRDGLGAARAHQQELRGVLERLSARPWYAATFVGTLDTGGLRVAAVTCNGSTRVVPVADDVPVDTLRAGDAVLLGSEMNVVLQRLSAPLPRTDETAEFQHVTADGRFVVRHRDEELLVHPVPSLDVSTLAPGDRVRWDRSLGMAFERVERTAASALFLEETPAEGFDAIGGLDRQIAAITRSVRLHVLHPDVAQRYQVRRVGSILLAGPPGTGKTMLARGLAHWLGRHAPTGRARFMAVKPAALHSMWYGQSEANYREAFRVARQAGERDPATPVVMFFDEVDAIGAVRGQALGQVDDRVLTSFMTELDGLEGRGNILVVAATNRRDVLDPALARPGRLGDLVVEIPRPGRVAAAAVFEKHLPAGIPYGLSEAADAGGARRELIETVVSRLYAPNGEGDLATLVFRDGTRRSVRPADVINGARLANIARTAIERACLRDLEGGQPGVAGRDLLDAVSEELAGAARALTPANCHAFITDLPQDLGVARVELVARQVRRPHCFRSVA